jgi:rare lipoprotein A
MSRIVLAGALLCALANHAFAPDVDPYACFGAGRYQAMSEGKVCPSSRKETCIASTYGRESGPRTASGERFDPNAMTCAHKTRAFGSVVTVTMLATGRSISCRVNDRGPFVVGRCIDLSTGAARALGLSGIAKVRVD